MAGLTVKEKEHWKDRLGRRIDKKNRGNCTADPNYMDRVKGQARQKAMESLGLAELQAELDAIEREESDLKMREQAAHRAMLALVRHVPVEEVDERLCTYSEHQEVSGAIARRQAVHEEEVLAGDEQGRKILQLRQEKEGLLDSVWLATSPVQLRELWQKVGDLLGDEPTTLQKDALTIGISPTE